MRAIRVVLHDSKETLVCQEYAPNSSIIEIDVLLPEVGGLNILYKWKDAQEKVFQSRVSYHGSYTVTWVIEPLPQKASEPYRLRSTERSTEQDKGKTS